MLQILFAIFEFYAVTWFSPLFSRDLRIGRKKLKDRVCGYLAFLTLESTKPG